MKHSKILIYSAIFIVLFVVNFLIVRLFVTEIFKYTVICLLIMFVILFASLKKYTENTYEAFFASFSTISFLFVFNVFFPIFIDRSISYHIVMKSVERPLNIEEFAGSEYISKSCVMRFPELEGLGLVKVTNNTAYPTLFGKIFAKIMNFTGDIFDKKNGYFKETDKIND